MKIVLFSLLVFFSLSTTSLFAQEKETKTEETKVEAKKEEVLYGLVLSNKTLSIKVATGGCTTNKSFAIEVNKGFTGQPPYMVTVRRKAPDNCKKFLSPIWLKYSRKNLDIEGLVEFNITNMFGNSSNHR